MRSCSAKLLRYVNGLLLGTAVAVDASPAARLCSSIPLHISSSILPWVLWGFGNHVALSQGCYSPSNVQSATFAALNERSTTPSYALLYFPSTWICPPFPTCSWWSWNLFMQIFFLEPLQQSWGEKSVILWNEINTQLCSKLVVEVSCEVEQRETSTSY